QTRAGQRSRAGGIGLGDVGVGVGDATDQLEVRADLVVHLELRALGALRANLLRAGTEHACTAGDRGERIALLDIEQGEARRQAIVEKLRLGTNLELPTFLRVERIGTAGR